MTNAIALVQQFQAGEERAARLGLTLTAQKSGLLQLQENGSRRAWCISSFDHLSIFLRGYEAGTRKTPEKEPKK